MRRTVSLVVLATTAAAFGGGAAEAAGPNAIRSNPAFSANTLPANDDGSSVQAPLGFNADFFGSTYDKAFVNNNGNITFDHSLGTFTPFALTPTGTTKIIAPFFGDVDTRGPGSGLTMYGYGTGQVDGHTAFGVNWIDVGYFNAHADKLNSFQLVLIQREDTGSPNNFDIEFNYDKIQWETGDASGGFNGFGGQSARAGYASGSGEAFELPNSGVDGALLDSNLSTGLIHNRLNSPQLGRYVLQVRNGVVLPTNGAPVADAAGDYAGAEGSAIAVDASGSSDPDGDALTYAWSVTSDAGNEAGSGCTIADATSAATTITCNEDGSYVASVDVSDATGTSTDTAAVAVSNVAPAIGARTLTGDTGTACSAGNTTGLAFSVSDAGALDEPGLTGTVDWGDGTTEPYSGTSFSGSHTYAPGTYTILVSATDDDGGTVSASETDAVSHLYATSGLQSPVNADGSSVFKLGSTVPLKVAVTDCAGALVSTLTPDVGLTRRDTSPDGNVNEVVSSSSADSGDDMRWSTDKYIYNLSTKRSQFCTSSSPMCSNGDLTAGTYDVLISDSAANAAFAPITGQFHLRK